MDFRQAYDPFRALGSAWKLLWKAPLALFLGGFLLWISDPWTGSEGQGVGRFDFDHGEFRLEEMAELAPFVGFGLCCGFLLFFFHCLLRIGYGAVVQRVMVTGEEQLADLFRPRGLYPSMLLGMLLHILLVFLALLPFGALVGGGIWFAEHGTPEPMVAFVGICGAIAWLPFFCWIFLGVVLIPEAVAIEGWGPFDALARSWSLTRGRRLHLFFYTLCTTIAALIGCCGCIPGMIFTYSWVTVAWYESYVRLTADESVPPMGIDREPAAEPRA